MAKEKFKNLVIIKPILKKFIKDELKLIKNKNEKIIIKLEEKDVISNKKLEKEFQKRLNNFSKLKDEKMYSSKSFKQFIVETINSFSELDKSIFLTILFNKNLNNISWKTFNISRSTFYRRLNFIEKIINWCLFE